MEIIKGMAERLIEQIQDTPEWMEAGLCTKDESLDPLFQEHEIKMLDLCRTCPVLNECNEHFTNVHESVRTIKHGVYGGKSYWR